jgi:hypothetical protein
MLNVDVDPRGGVTLRKGVTTFGDQLNLLTVNQYGLETNTTGWVADTNCAIARSTAQFFEGAASLELTSTASGNMSAATNVAGYRHQINPSTSYTATARVRAATSSRSANIAIQWRDAAAAVISTTTGADVADSTSAWSLVTVSGTAPSNAVQATILVTVKSTGAGSEVHYFDAISLPAEPHSITSLSTTGGTNQIVVGAGREILTGSGGAWSPMQISAANIDRVGPLRAVVFKDRLYIQSVGSPDDVVRWDGTTAVELVQPSYNNDLTNPTVPPANGEFPRAKCMAVFNGSVFVGNIQESGTAFPNRIRWSHPNFPEDWRDIDFIDVDTGVDGDQITALLPLDDRLVIFKNHSMFSVFGAPPDQLQIQPITIDVGAPSQEAVTLTEEGIYIWSTDSGMFLYDGRNISWRFERLFPLLDDNDISPTQSGDAVIGPVGRRVYLSVPTEAAAVRNMTYVLDPTLSKLGSWVQYDLPLGPFLEHYSSVGDILRLACHVGGTYILELEQDSAVDNFGSGNVHIESHYTTRWFDMNQPALMKRWRHPEIVVRDDVESQITVRAYKDYDYTTVKKEFYITTVPGGDVGIWDTSDWDDAVWGGDTGIKLRVHRGALLGSARAVALKFLGPITNVPWTIDSISFKFIFKKVR